MSCDRSLQIPESRVLLLPLLPATTRKQPSLRSLIPLLAALLAVLLASAGCKEVAKTTAEVWPKEGAKAKPVRAELEEGRRAAELATSGTSGGADLEPDNDLADEDDDEEDDRDYWKGVRFDRTNFDEILDYVQLHYIDPKPDTRRAWIEAANFALLTMEPGQELLPESFYTARKGHADEEGRLDGTTAPFTCGGKPVAGLMVHTLPTDEYLKAKRPVRKKGRLSNEEVMAIHNKQKARSQAYEAAWKAVAFEPEHFDCTMAYIQQQLPAMQAAMKKQQAQAEEIAPARSTDAKPTAAKPTAAKPTEAKPATDKEVAKAAGDGANKPLGADKKAADVAKSTDTKPKKPKVIPDMNRMWLSAASGYLYALDPHSSIIARRAWDESTDKTQDNSFEGIGAVLTQRDDQTLVENPMEGRPAWRAGIRAGDIIHKVDGVDVSGLALKEVVKKIRGPRATKVVLTISRESDPEPREIGIVRESIEIKNVDGKLLSDFPGVAHIKMSGFIPQSSKDLRAMIERLAEQAPGGKLQGLVLDLRNNSGGLLSKAIEISDMFLQKGRIVSVRSRNKAEEVNEARKSSDDYLFPLVVLVNDGSASASEIVASAIQDNGRGLVVGLRTFGKASVQTLFEPALHTDYYIKLTVARYYSPLGYTLQVVGVHPDAEVAPEVDGKMPVGFREENLNNHLVPIETPHKSPFAAAQVALDQCVKDKGQATALATKEPKPQIHPDFQLLRAADFIRCLAARPTPFAP
jgi:C-terminal peptidase prc